MEIDTPSKAPLESAAPGGSITAAEFKVLAESMESPLCLVEDGKLVYFNSAFSEFSGYSPPELIQLKQAKAIFENLADLGLQNSDRQRKWHDIVFRKKSGESVKTEAEAIRLSHKDGQAPRHLLRVKVPDETESLYYALQKAEQRLRYISRTGQELFWECDLKSNRLWCSESATILFKYSSDDIPRTLDDLLERIHPDTAEKIGNEVRAVIKTKRPLWLAEFKLKKGDGVFADVICRAFLLLDPDGNPVSLVGSLMDATVNKRLESRCNELHRLATLGGLTKGVVHNLNNVFTPILSAVEILRKDMFLSESEVSLLQKIHENSLRGVDLVEKLSDYSGAEPGAGKDVDVKKVLETVVHMMRETLPKNIRIKVETGDFLGQAKASPLSLQQVFLALAEVGANSVASGGEIIVTAKHVDIDQQFALSRPGVEPGRFLRISFKCYDNGDPSNDDGGSVTNNTDFVTRESMSALLRTLKEAVSKTMGFVDANTSLASMKAFEFYLPSGPAEAPSEEEIQDWKHFQGHGELILLVDDEEGIRKVTAQLLEKNGYRVEAAPNGAIAISSFLQKQTQIALVIMDLDMPVMDGVTAIRTFREIDPHLRIIASTGSSRKEEEIHASLFSKKAHADAFLRKPYTAYDLLKSVQMVLAG